jgi:NADH-ubiquinone oxidoreductase chain 5
MAGICANYETDLKKVIALSTLSQLGLIIICLSLGFVTLAYFHLLTHALFKALLFMCAGAVIHSSGESQDIRFIGSLISFMPVVGVCIRVANFALCGFPFLAGFYSKDVLIEMSLVGNFNFLIIILLMISVGLTSVYSFRLSYYSMWRYVRGRFFSSVDGGHIINFAIILLGRFAVIGGSILG